MKKFVFGTMMGMLIMLDGVLVGVATQSASRQEASGFLALLLTVVIVVCASFVFGDGFKFDDEV